MILVLRLSNSGFSPAMYPSSVVHTGVKSLGCENRMAQLSPIHSWKLIFPCEVSAVKLGASSLMRSICWSPDLFESKRGFVRKLSRNKIEKSNVLGQRHVNFWPTAAWLNSEVLRFAQD